MLSKIEVNFLFLKKPGFMLQQFQWNSFASLYNVIFWCNSFNILDKTLFYV